MELLRSLRKFFGKEVKEKVLIIGGPTASGKTKIALEIAKLVNGEIINCDSIQFYKELNVGSNKTIDQTIPHHLFDILSINDKETLPSGEFSKIARKLINEIHSRKKIPICVGGSGFYIQNLIYGAPSNPKSSVTDREKLVNELKTMGWEKG
jgi:tRNA dimethylallyltransferase